MTFLVIVFVVTLLATGGAYLFTQRAFDKSELKKVRDRLTGKEGTARKGAAKTPAQSLFVGEGEDNRTVMAVILAQLNIDRKLQTLIEQAGVGWAPGQAVLACLGSALAVFNVCWYLAPPEIRGLAVPIGLGAGALPIFYLKFKKARRIASFEAQFPDALQFIARAMKAGHAFSVSLEMLHREFSEPLSGEFRRVFEEQNLGLPIDTALEKLGRRLDLLDVQFFVAAVILQKRTGGNLAEILEKLSSLIRERFKLRGQIRAVSAHGKMSSSVLTGIPIVVAFMMYFVNRDHMMFFVEQEMGQWMAGLAVAFVVLGYVIMRQITKIEVW